MENCATCKNLRNEGKYNVCSHFERIDDIDGTLPGTITIFNPERSICAEWEAKE